MRVSLVQMTCDQEKKKNVEKALKYIEEAANRGSDIVCLQELFSTPYVGSVEDPKFFELAEPITGPSISAVKAAAKEFKVSVVAPFFEEDLEVRGRFFNTAAVIGGDGEVRGVYRKTHLPHLVGYFEKFYFAVGNLPYPVFKTGKANIGVVICYDRHFPEGVRIEALKGAEVVFIPTCTYAYPELWELEIRAHAAFNTIFVAGVNRVGKEFPQQPTPFYGKSMVANPRGEVIARAGGGEEILTVDLNLEEIRERRKVAPFLTRDRAPQLYGELVKFE